MCLQGDAKADALNAAFVENLAGDHARNVSWRIR
jgi:hypothetical protein